MNPVYEIKLFKVFSDPYPVPPSGRDFATVFLNFSFADATSVINAKYRKRILSL